MNGTVLIVDDEAFVRDTLRTMIELNETGWTVVAEAENGAEAIDRIRELAPDLVITDVRMPLVDGLEVAEWVHLNQERTKVVILTGYRDFTYAQAALRFGVVDFLLKPCPEREVCALLERLYDRLCEEENTIEAQWRSAEDATLRALFYRLPCDVEIVRRLEPALTGMALFLAQVNRFSPDSENEKSGDWPVLQSAIGDSIREFVEQSYELVRIVQLNRERYALFLGKAKRGDSGETIGQLAVVAAKIAELFAISVTFRSAGIVDRLDRLPQLSVETDLSDEEGVKQIGVIERAQAYIERNYMDRCTLQMVAAHVYLHPNYFSELFKRETGLGFQQYLTQLRMEKAVALLNNPDARVAEIAREVGYDDPNYFSTLFSKKYQMSPNEYRKRNDTRKTNN